MTQEMVCAKCGEQGEYNGDWYTMGSQDLCPSCADKGMIAEDLKEFVSALDEFDTTAGGELVRETYGERAYDDFVKMVKRLRNAYKEFDYED